MTASDGSGALSLRLIREGIGAIDDAAAAAAAVAAAAAASVTGVGGTACPYTIARECGCPAPTTSFKGPGLEGGGLRASRMAGVGAPTRREMLLPLLPLPLLSTDDGAVRDGRAPLAAPLLPSTGPVPPLSARARVAAEGSLPPLPSSSSSSSPCCWCSARLEASTRGARHRVRPAGASRSGKVTDIRSARERVNTCREASRRRALNQG